MKYLLLVGILFFCSSFDWQRDFDIATQQAKTEKKIILLNFSGSDWCIPCMKLKRNLFQDSLFMVYADSNLILVNADFPSDPKLLTDAQKKKNEALAEKYNPDGLFPYTLLIDTLGVVNTTWTGYINTPSLEYITTLDKIIHSISNLEVDSTSK